MFPYFNITSTLVGSGDVVVLVWVVIAVVRVPGSITYMVTSVQDLKQQLKEITDENGNSFNSMH